MSTDVSTIGPPALEQVGTPAEFVAALRALRAQVQLTVTQLERNALERGDRLPRRTIARALSAQGIPRAETIASFVRACGGDQSAVELWLAVRRRIARMDRTVGDLAVAVEIWLAGRWAGTGAAARRSAARRSADLDAAVAEWLSTRWQAGTVPSTGRHASIVDVRPSTRDLTHSTVDGSATPVTRPSPVDRRPAGSGRAIGRAPVHGIGTVATDSAYGFTHGWLAEAVAQSTTGRWKGVHRRKAVRHRVSPRPHPTAQQPPVQQPPAPAA